MPAGRRACGPGSCTLSSRDWLGLGAWEPLISDLLALMMEGPCGPAAGQGPEVCEEGQEGKGVGAFLRDWQVGLPGRGDHRHLCVCVIWGQQCREAAVALGEIAWRPIQNSAVPAPPGPLRSMVEDLQSEESDEDDSSSGEEATVKANPGRDSR